MIKKESNGDMKILGKFSIAWGNWLWFIACLGVLNKVILKEAVWGKSKFIFSIILGSIIAYGLIQILRFSRYYIRISHDELFVGTPTKMYGKEEKDFAIDLEDLSHIQLTENNDLYFYQNREEYEILNLDPYNHEDIQVLLNLLAKRKIPIKIDEEMKKKGYVLPNQSLKQNVEDLEKTSHRRRKVVENSDETIKNPPSSKQSVKNSKSSTHNRRLEF